MTDQTQQSRTETGGFNWERAAACTLCIGAGVLALRLFFRYLLGVLMPFALAYLLARLLRPAVDFLTGGRRRQTASTRAGRRVLSATLVVLFTGLVVWLTVAGVRRGVGELENLLLRLQDVLADGDGQADGAPGFSRALDYIWSVSEHLPFLRRFESTPGFSRFCDWLDGAVRTLVQDLVSRLSGMLSAGAVTLLGSLPSVLLFLTVLLLSCYYFTAEPGGVSRLVAARIPARWRAGLSRWQAGAGRSLRRYLRAALLLALLTFLEMFVGLTLLRKPYAFLLALLIAFVDFLPVLGTGTVLIPWGIGELLLGSTGSGLGILALYAISSVLREIAEPHLVGRSLGIHPLLSLLSMYAGFRLFGIPGMVLAPLAAAVIKGAGDREAAGKGAGGKETLGAS